MLAIAVAVGVSGCAVRSRPAIGYVELSSAPVYLAEYPRTYYDGRIVYLVNDRWMFDDGGRWAYYRDEPVALRRQRPYVQQAPPVYVPPAYGVPSYSTPYHPYRGAPYRTAPPAAPPAVRVQ